MTTGTTDHPELSSPPRPPLAFRVGVVGHRPNRLGGADLPKLAAVIRNILEAVQSEVRKVGENDDGLFAPDPPLLRAVSPLAEGTDRLFAEQAMKLGWELFCVMPFPQEEFERDFTGKEALEENSLDRFRKILQTASTEDRLTCLQLDGVRDEKDGNPYGTCGSVVEGLSDLMIVVWDGERQGKRGGTEETLASAQQAGKPVVLVDAKDPHSWRLLGASEGDLAAVRTAVARILLPLAPDEEEVDPKEQTEPRRTLENLRQYFTEHRPRWSTAVFWKVFRDVVGDFKFPKVSWKVPPFEQAVLAEWPDDQSSPGAAMIDQLRPYYAWPDKLAEVYANRYRSSFLSGYMLAAVAVGMALLPLGLGHPWLESLWYAVELGCLLGILLLFVLARSRKWHERWLDYRLAAELIRHLRVVGPICGQPPFPNVPTHQTTYGQPEDSWMNWHLRAITRAVGLGCTVLDHQFLQRHLARLKKLLEGQVNFHAATEHRSKTIERRLHVGIGVLLGLTLLSCVLHLLPTSAPGHLLTFLCGFLPAVGAMLAAINNQGEFRRMAKRSSAMRNGITRLIKRIDTLAEEMSTPGVAATKSFLPTVRRLSDDTADLLLREVLDWRVLFLDRPPEVGP